MSAEVDPEVCRRLVAECSEDDQRMTPGRWIGGADCVTVYKAKHERGAGAVLAEMTQDERHEDNAVGIARTRNNLPAIAAQLTAAAELHERYAQAQADILLQAARLAALESELATLQASIVAALSSAGPEVGEDERAG